MANWLDQGIHLLKFSLQDEQVGCSCFVDRIAGCLVGGVVGNAIGKATRRMSAPEAMERIKNLSDGPLPAKLRVSSDAAFLLTTAEGLLRADSRQKDRGICSVSSVVLNNYHRLLAQQGYPVNTFGDAGWLLREAPIRRQGNPVRTTYRALLSGKPVPNKGSGTVVRTAPCGLFDSDSYKLGYEVAGLTHSSFPARIAAGLLAVLTEKLVARPAGSDPKLIFTETFDRPGLPKRGAKVKELGLYGCSVAKPDLKILGAGRDAAQALALGCHFVLNTSDFASAVRKAASFGGEHATVGCVTGCLAGALHGYSGLAEEWMQGIELFQAAKELAADIVLYRWCGAHDPVRYPPH